MRRRSASTALPSSSIAPHCSSLYGKVTRGASQTRRTDMWCSKVVSHGSSVPLIGAADDGSGEHASGMWPSPA